MAETLRGVVKWFNDAKGFGFIEHESGKDVFVHYSVITQEGFKTLKDGEEVLYELSQGDKGLHAAKVVRLSIAQAQEQSAKEGDAALVEAQMIAPNLESGTVNTAIKTAAAMIEKESISEDSEMHSEGIARTANEKAFR